MNIEDILAEVDQDGLPQETRDLQDLTRAWVTERSAPEVLPVASVLDRARPRPDTAAGEALDNVS